MMAMKNNKYWEQRFIQLEESQILKGQAFYAELEEQYRFAMDSVEKDISRWYTRFADNNQISLTEAKRLLNTRELDEFKWNVKQYIKHGEANAITHQWMKQLENASARVHISRLESLQIQLQHQAELLYGNQLDGLDKLARNIYSEGYYHTAYEIQKGFNVGWDLQPLSDRQISRVISKPWAVDGRAFSDRIWTNKQQLVGSLHTGLTQTLIRGDSPQKAIKNIANEFNVSKKKAGRLVMTESAFFASTAQQDCFKDLDVDRFQIVATLDRKTSPICQDLDGKVFKMSDYQIGVTAPPFHPWCRTTSIPYFEDNYGERIARNPKTGKTYHVPSDMKYGEWYNKHVSKATENRLKTELIGLKTSNGIEIKQVAKHMIDRTIQRNVPIDDIKDALISPLLVRDIRDDRSQKFIGVKATVAINADTGKLIQTNPTSRKYAARLKRKGKK